LRYELLARPVCPRVVAWGLGNDADGLRGLLAEMAVGDGFLPQLNQFVGDVTPLLHPEIPSRSVPSTTPTDHRESEDRMVLRPLIRLTLIDKKTLELAFEPQIVLVVHKV